MISSYEEFETIVLNWLLNVYGEPPSSEPEETDTLLHSLFNFLGLDIFVERLYILCREDARGEAKDLGYSLERLGLNENEGFWRDVQKGIEVGLGICWTDIVEIALEEALSKRGITKD